MHTDTSSSFGTYRSALTTGQSLGFELTEGSEVFCSQGCLQLSIVSTAPAAFLGSSLTQVQLLHCGQAWRAPSASRIQISSAQKNSAMQIHQAPETQNRHVLGETGRSGVELQSHQTPTLTVLQWLMRGARQSVRKLRRAQHAA